MDFTHTETRQMLADTLGRWVLNDYPLADRLAAGQSETGFAPEKFAALAELGALGAVLPESAGGFGGEGFDIVVLFEALGRGLVVEPVLQSAVLGGAILAACGKEDLVTEIISGTEIVTLAHDEGGMPGEEITTDAARFGDGWVLNGAKSVIRAAEAATHLIVTARTDAGTGLFLVRSDAAGLSLHGYPTIDGGRAAEVKLDNLSLHNAACLTTDGAATLEEAMGRGLLALVAEALGLMETIKDLTIEYVRTRKQFGVPIGKFQALQHRIAEMMLEIEQARSAVIRAASVLEQPGIERERALSAAKVTIGRVGTLIGEETIQIHGGMGMTWEYPVGHFVKRLTMIGHEMGDEDFHLMRYIQLGKTA